MPYTPRKKPTGLDWGPVVNPRVWAEARNEVYCLWPNCLNPVTNGAYCFRHVSLVKTRERIEKAEKEHPPCRNCGGVVKKRRSDSYAMYEKRRYCSPECWREAAPGLADFGGATRICRTCNKEFFSAPSDELVNCPDCRGARRCEVPGCNEPHKMHGMCRRHAKRVNSKGKTSG